jgi:hypothetical protein
MIMCFSIPVAAAAGGSDSWSKIPNKPGKKGGKGSKLHVFDQGLTMNTVLLLLSLQVAVIRGARSPRNPARRGSKFLVFDQGLTMNTVLLLLSLQVALTRGARSPRSLARRAQRVLSCMCLTKV